MSSGAVERMIEAIQRHDAADVAELLCEDAVLIDSEGAALRGRERLEAAWRRYFELFPDYWIEISTALAVGSTVALFGSASGSVSGADGERALWRIPAAWRVVVRGERIAEWQVYADLAPVRELLGGRG